MEGIQGAALGVKLRHLDAWTARRQQIGSRYTQLLSSTPAVLPVVPEDRTHVYHVYGIRVDERDSVQEALSASGIATGIHYPVPVHRQPAYRDSVVVSGSLSITDEAFSRLLSLPIYPELRDEQVEYVCSRLTEVLGQQV